MIGAVVRKLTVRKKSDDRAEWIGVEWKGAERKPALIVKELICTYQSNLSSKPLR